MALVPAVCETFGLRFVGPDTYGRIVAQDKDISKSLAALAGLQVVPHRIVRSPEDLRWIDGFPVPYVVKPLFEGSSIGIEQCNLINAATEGPPVVRDLLDRYAQPIMVEQFIPGREVNWCFVECCDGPCAVFTELVHTVDPSFFENHLYDASLKLDLSAPVTITTIDNDLHPDDARMLKGLLRLVGHVGYGRIDGKLRNGRFVFLEFSALL
jgi:D-alanine-D-alanine ligase